jgi:flagellar protein FliL
MAMPKKKLLMILIPVLLLGGGGGAFMMMGGKDKKADAHGEAPAEGEHAEAKADEGGHGEEGKASNFYELPDIVVNLNSEGKKQGSFLKIKINLEMADAESAKKVEAMLPRIVDNLQVYLRELRVEDIQGSEGLYRLREELLHRVNTAASPAKINE